MLFCLHVEFVFMLMSFNRLTDDLLKDNPPSKFGWLIFAAQICLFSEKYENPRNLGIVRACADKSHLCSIRGIRGTLWNILPLLSSLWKFSWISSFLYALGYRDGDCTSQRRRIYDYNLRNGKLFSVILPCLDLIRGFDILLTSVAREQREICES